MYTKRLAALGVAVSVTILAHSSGFEYLPPGDLIPRSGQGLEDWTVYQEGMRFPLEKAPAYANSQVWSPGGNQGPPGRGDQCDPDNYSYPWRDNYCETRAYRMQRCPAGRGHQGQDIRPATCHDGVHWAVAAEAGQVINIGSKSVWLQGDDSGFRYRYLHLSPDRLAVESGQRVERGDRIGLVSDWNADDGHTTIHLHFDMYSAGTYFPTYMSLVSAYESLLAGSP